MKDRPITHEELGLLFDEFAKTDTIATVAVKAYIIGITDGLTGASIDTVKTSIRRFLG